GRFTKPKSRRATTFHGWQARTFERPPDRPRVVLKEPHPYVMVQILKASALLVILSGIFVDVQAERETEAEAQAKTEKSAMAAAQEAKLLAELKTVEDVNSDLSAIEKSDNQKAQIRYTNNWWNCVLIDAP
ncbi:MAG: hypothetical protein M3495_07995, partial [Pseudomonadota bacterium]|nr:hypothetical protein [Pseudomonadota bacterium]